MIFIASKSNHGLVQCHLTLHARPLMPHLHLLMPSLCSLMPGGGEYLHTWEYCVCAAGQGAFLVALEAETGFSHRLTAWIYQGIISSKIVIFTISNISVPCPYAQLWGRTVIKKLSTFFGPGGRDRSQSPPCWSFWVKQIHPSTASERITRLPFMSFQLWHRVYFLSFQNWDRVLFWASRPLSAEFHHFFSNLKADSLKWHKQILMSLKRP